jgi:hypothetical protein
VSCGVAVLPTLICRFDAIFIKTNKKKPTDISRGHLFLFMVLWIKPRAFPCIC